VSSLLATVMQVISVDVETAFRAAVDISKITSLKFVVRRVVDV
jgi:hypothetical protein